MTWFRFQCVALALPVLGVLKCSDTGRASVTQRLISDKASIHAKSRQARDVFGIASFAVPRSRSHASGFQMLCNSGFETASR
jgi:hypothetical protein